jgi:hypothetical protein
MFISSTAAIDIRREEKKINETSYKNVKRLRGRVVVDLYDLMPQIEQLKIDEGFASNSEFFRHIAREYIRSREAMKPQSKTA